MKRTQLLSLFLLTAWAAFAQSVAFDMPKNANLQMTMLLKNGIKTDTLFSGHLDNKGQLTVPIPKDYRGIAVIVPDRPGAYYEFILAGEDMILHCEEEYPYTGVVKFENSPENDSMDAWFTEQAIRQQKIAMLSELKQLYTQDDRLLAELEKEQEDLEKSQAAFESMLSESPLYAARFMELHNFLNKDVAGLLWVDSVQLAKTRQQLVEDLDVQSLYTSGIWFDVINGLLALYDQDSPYHANFIQDMAKVLNRADDNAYHALAENLFEICESTGWHYLEEELAYFLINDGRIKNPTGKLKKLMTIFKLGKGSQAPDLVDGRRLRNAVLVFYETGCGSCENEMQQLKGNYPILKEKGYEVVSISADSDLTIFENTAKQFPWSQKYCDGEGFEGKDFQNYGVIGTPTFYVIDKQGIVQGRYARLADTGILDKE